MVEKPIVTFHPAVIDYLDGLSHYLYDSDYLGFQENAIRYVNTMVQYISQNIHLNPSRISPSYFSKYGKDLRYILYCPNQNTTWYVFFQNKENQYLVRYITNNHVEGHYIR